MFASPFSASLFLLLVRFSLNFLFCRPLFCLPFSRGSLYLILSQFCLVYSSYFSTSTCFHLASFFRFLLSPISLVFLFTSAFQSVIIQQYFTRHRVSISAFSSFWFLLFCHIRFFSTFTLLAFIFIHAFLSFLPSLFLCDIQASTTIFKHIHIDYFLSSQRDQVSFSSDDSLLSFVFCSCFPFLRVSTLSVSLSDIQASTSIFKHIHLDYFSSS